MTIRRVIVFCFICVFTQVSKSEERSSYKIVGSTIEYKGPIDSTFASRFCADIKNTKIKVLKISSLGGDPEQGMVVGALCYDSCISVLVPDYCLSACANYIVPAAPDAQIGRKAVLAWHGSPLYIHDIFGNDIFFNSRVKPLLTDTMNVDSAYTKCLYQTKRVAELERTFFLKIKVDPAIMWCGLIAPYTLDMFGLTENSLKKFGALNIHYPRGNKARGRLIKYGKLCGKKYDIIDVTAK
jgi:hypothetical protein